MEIESISILVTSWRISFLDSYEKAANFVVYIKVFLHAEGTLFNTNGVVRKSARIYPFMGSHAAQQFRGDSFDNLEFLFYITSSWYTSLVPANGRNTQHPIMWNNLRLSLLAGIISLYL